MAQWNFSIALSTLALAASLMSASPSVAFDKEECGMPDDAVVSLPSPLRSWAQLGCTPLGETLSSRDGWVWASLRDANKVTIVAGSVPKGPDLSGDASYFTKIDVTELGETELAAALAAFHKDLEFRDGRAKAYRVDLTMAEGDTARIFFFDFGAFAGGMWCPYDNCVAESRFLIMKKESKGLIETSTNNAACCAQACRSAPHHLSFDRSSIVYLNERERCAPEIVRLTMTDRIVVATFNDTNADYEAASAIEALKDEVATDFKLKTGVLVKEGWPIAPS